MEVCKPDAAKHVLESDPEIGLLLPCTIAVYGKNGENWISLAKPTALLAAAHSEELAQLGRDIETRLVGVIQNAK